MSRGPGRVQRRLLRALKRHGSLVVRDLLPSRCRHSHVSSLHRAAHGLVATGRALIDHEEPRGFALLSVEAAMLTKANVSPATLAQDPVPQRNASHTSGP